ncbi:D-amino-acid transaminase [bacterium]|nr:D-amino-acid transaminase [bacterium]
MPTFYLNGDYVPREQALIPVEDRGFIFGDGIYEGVRAVEGQLYEWDLHAERMVRGLAGLRIKCGVAEVEELRGVCERLVRENGLEDAEAFLYLQVTRGAAPRTHYFPPASTKPTVFVSATRFVVPRAMRDNGCSAITHEDMRWSRCDWKTVNLLGSVLARESAQEVGAYEAILHRDGVVTEGAATNVLAVIDGVLRTHPLTPRILPGVTRIVVMSLVEELGIPCREIAFTLDELSRASEVFLCGSTTDVTPVVSIDGATVGSGAPGPVTTQLRTAFEARLYALASATR